MPQHGIEPLVSGIGEVGRSSPRRTGGAARRWVVAVAVVVSLLSVVVVVRSASASSGSGLVLAENPFERGPAPSQSSVAATRGSFATAQVGVPGGSGFGGGVIYYPTDTSQGRFGALAVVPGYTATWAAEGAWMGHWLASFGFVVIGIDTNSRNDWFDARGAQLLAALDYLTQRSAVRDRVDGSRAAVMGHSMGGGGAMWAAANRPSLKATIGLAPAIFDFNLSNLRVPAMLMAGQNDGTVTPSAVTGNYNQVPGSTEKAYLELSGAGHGFPTSSNSVMTRKVIPWLKIFVDRDARYSQFSVSVDGFDGGADVSEYVSVVAGGADPDTDPDSPRLHHPRPRRRRRRPRRPRLRRRHRRSPARAPRPTGPSTAGRADTRLKSPSRQATRRSTAGPCGGRWPTARPSAQLWNGALTTNGSAVTVRNVAHNGALQPGASTDFGFLGGGTSANPTLSCTSP